MPAFNRTFAAVGLPVQWSDADIGDKTLLASLVSAIGVAVMFEAVSKSFTAASA